MERRTLFAVGLAGIVVPAAAQARMPEHARIGMLITGSAPHPVATAVPRQFSKLGHPASSVTWDIRYADRSNEKAARLARELVDTRPDALVAHFTPATKALKRATSSIPIVFAPAGAPVETGLVASLSRPGGNVTGITNLGSVIGGRRIQVLIDLIPSFKRLAVLGSVDDPFSAALVADLQLAARPAQIEVRPLSYDAKTDIEALFVRVDELGPQGLVMQGLVGDKRSAALKAASLRKLPVMAFEKEYVHQGGLVCVVGSEDEIYRRAAAFVDRILRGAAPADLPVEQPTSVELTINRTVARDLGLTIPPAVLAAADDVVD